MITLDKNKINKDEWQVAGGRKGRLSSGRQVTAAPAAAPKIATPKIAPPPAPPRLESRQESESAFANRIVRSQERQDFPDWFEINALETIKVRPSQDSVKDVTFEGIPIYQLAKDIINGNWRHYEPLPAVKMPDGIWTSLGNRRVTAAYLAVATSIAPDIRNASIFKGELTTVTQNIYDHILSVPSANEKKNDIPSPAVEKRIAIEGYAQRCNIKITSYDLAHYAPVQKGVGPSIDSFGEGQALPLPPTLTKGSYGHAIYLRMHAGCQKTQEFLARAEKRGELLYGFNHAPIIRTYDHDQ